MGGNSTTRCGLTAEKLDDVRLRQASQTGFRDATREISQDRSQQSHWRDKRSKIMDDGELGSMGSIMTKE